MSAFPTVTGQTSPAKPQWLGQGTNVYSAPGGDGGRGAAHSRKVPSLPHSPLMTLGFGSGLGGGGEAT